MKADLKEITASAKVIFDVRSPAEFKHAHIPGAINIPLFSDEERKDVGTLYKQQGKETAVLKGLEIVGVKMKSLAQEMLDKSENKQALMYCWRGGMRSSSMAWLAKTVGVEVDRIEGGYKAYRNSVIQCLSSDWKLKVIGGYTGSGKTALLKKLREAGCQVLDLEAIANHKGSAFGHLGENEQPTTEMFENKMAFKLLKMNNEKPIWIEDESKNVGSVFIQHEFYQNLRKSPLYLIEKSFEERHLQLMEVYGGFPPEKLVEALHKIVKRLGPEKYANALDAIRIGNISEAVKIVLKYYDDMYNYQITKKENVSKEWLSEKALLEKIKVKL